MRLYVRVILFYKNIDTLENSGSLASLQAYLQIIKILMNYFWVEAGLIKAYHPAFLFLGEILNYYTHSYFVSVSSTRITSLP